MFHLILQIPFRQNLYMYLYAPNDDCPQFFKEIDSKFQCDSTIFGGHFNCVLNLSLDKKGGWMLTNFKARTEIMHLMERGVSLILGVTWTPMLEVTLGGQTIILP